MKRSGARRSRPAQRNGDAPSRPNFLIISHAMLAKVITLHFDSITNAFDDEPLKEFIKDKEVHSIRDHFFIRNDAPYLAMIVTYSMPAQLLPQTKSESKKDESWRELIDEKDVPLFNSLRDWRNERAKKEGLSPYIVFTKRMAFARIRRCPGLHSALGCLSAKRPRPATFGRRDAPEGRGGSPFKV